MMDTRETKWSRRALVTGAVAGGVAGSIVPSILLLRGASAAATDSKPTVGIDARRAPFNAKGDGRTDDTAAIQAAIDRGQETRGIVLLPATGAQHYVITKPLRITRPVRLVGESMFGTTLYAKGLGANQVAIDIDGTVNPNLEGVEVEGFTVMSDNSRPNLIRLNRAANCAFRDLGLRDGHNGILITSERCYTNTFDRIIHITGLRGATVRFERFTGGGQFTFVGCSFGGSDGVAFDRYSQGSALAFINCNFEHCKTSAFACAGTIKGLTFSGCRFEKNAGAYTIDLSPVASQGVYGLDVAGCFFETDGEAAAFNFGGPGGQIRGFSIRGSYFEGYTTNLVRFNGEGESGIISGNFMDRNLVNIVSTTRPNVEVVGNEHLGGKYPNQR